jgi:SPOR domain
MHSRLFLISTVVFLSICRATAFADSGPEVPYTLQVGAFPRADLADKFVVKLVQAGEHPACATVELEGRGYWTRVSVGLFSTSTAARRYGESLIAKGIVNEFLVRKADLSQSAYRPRRVTAGGSFDRQSAVKSLSSYGPGRTEVLAQMSLDLRSVANRPDSLARDAGYITVNAEPLGAIRDIPTSRPLADFRPAALALGPGVDTRTIPRPEPVALAFRLIVGETRPRPLPSRDRGGLWLTGDTAEGLERLKWIVGEENAELVKLDNDGRVQLDRRLLAKAARLDGSHVEDPLQVAYYISANEGLLLLVQLAEGGYRYLIHVGRHVPTRGKTVEITGSINLDRNFDSRINKYRKDGRKLDEEQPPEGVDSLVGLNPIARWFNLGTNCWVQSGEILFHELAEAYAKLEFGLDYLEHGSEPGAHALALERERRLQSQRPDAHIVMTVGSNRVLRTQAEIRLFYAESVTAASQH